MGVGGRAPAVVLGLAFAAAAPAVASANTTYCVPNKSIAGCPSGATAKTTIANALTAVNGHSGQHDTIRIGPGTFNEGGLQDTQRVDIIGEGQGQTVIQPSGTASGTATLALDVPTSTARDLSIGVSRGASNTGLLTEGTATRVAVSAPSGATSPAGISAIGASVRNSTVTAAFGILSQGVASVTRTRVIANLGIVVGEGSNATIDDSMIQTVPGPASEVAVAALASGIAFSDARAATLRHDTLVGDGSSGSVGIQCSATGITNPASCTTTVDSSIIRGFQHAISRSASGSVSSANVSVDHSDLDPTTDLDGNTSSGTGHLTLGSHDLNVDPAFAATSGSLAFQLSTPSPVIDKGNPTLGSGESTTDLAGNPRAVAGHNGGSAVSDMGAFEYQPHPPTLTASGPSATKVGTPATFTATTNDPDPGDVVTVTWQFDDGSSATGASVTHVFASTGPHVATASATDLDGFMVSAAPTRLTVGTHPVVSGLKLKPKKFKARKGTTVSYTDSQAAVTKLTVLHPVAGIRKGGKCLAPGKHPPKHAKRCTRWVPLKRSFKHQDVAGKNSFHFKDKKLKPGRYRLQVVASDANGTAAAVMAAFTIV
jgi:hypothetical protein